MAYRLGNRMAAATAATANHVAAQLWNPSTAVNLWVKEVHLVQQVAGVTNIGILRSSTKGATFGNELTATIDSDTEHRAAPPSGAQMETAAITTQPTLIAATLYHQRWNEPSGVGAGVIFVFPDAIKVKPGNGLCVVTPTAVAFPVHDVTFCWFE